MTKDHTNEITAFFFPINIEKKHLKLQKKESNTIITLFFLAKAKYLFHF
jgi:hypothetical protein